MWEWQPADCYHYCAYHLENLLDEDDLPEGDRRALVAQLASLRVPAAGDPAAEKRQVAALRLLQSVAPKAWALTAPIVQVILTAEMRRQLGLPPA